MLSCLYLLFFYPLLLTLQAAYFPQASNFQNLVFFPLPIVFSILSIMLQAIFQKLMVVVVVVFFYLLILKGPMFLPGLVFFFFLQKQVECVFVLDGPCSLGRCQRSPQRGQAGGQDASSMSGIWRSSKGGPGPWATLAGVLILGFSHFLARPHYHMPDLMCRTFFLVHKFSLFAQPNTPNCKSTKNLLSKVACAFGATALLISAHPGLQTQLTQRPTVHQRQLLPPCRIILQSGQPRLSASRTTWKPRPPTIPTGLKSHSTGPLWGAPQAPPLHLTAFAYLL